MKTLKFPFPAPMFLMILICFSATVKNNDFTISGEIRNLKQDTIFFETPTGAIDAIRTTNGKFTYTGKIDYPDVFTLYVDSKYETFARIFVENGNITVSGDAESITKLSVKGSASHMEYIGYRKRIESLLNHLTEVDKQLGLAMKSGNMDIADSLAAVYQKLADDRLKDVLSYSKEQKESKIIPYITARASIDSPDAATIEQIFQNMDDGAKKSPAVASTKEMLKNLAKTSVGAKAPEFTLISKDGQTISLASLRGKVVLIDFWASWCGPCRLNHPDLVKTFNQYKGDNFRLISISLDKKKSDWEKAIEKDNLTWLQACDLQGAKGIISKSYGIETIPSSFLIDQNGIIIAKNLHGKHLRAAIEKLVSID